MKWSDLERGRIPVWKRRKSIPVLILIAALAITVLIWQSLQARVAGAARDLMMAEAEGIIQTIDGKLEQVALAMDRMAQRWEGQGGRPYRDWQTDGYNYHTDLPGNPVIAMVDQAGAIRHSVPTVEDIGFDLSDLGDLSAVAANEGADSNPSPTALREVRATSGAAAIISITPVRRAPAPDYYLLGIYSSESFLRALLENANPQLAIRVHSAGREAYFKPARGELADGPIIDTRPLDVRGYSISLRVTPSVSAVSASASASPIAALLFGIVMALLLFVASYQWQRLRLYQPILEDEVQRHTRDLDEARFKLASNEAFLRHATEAARLGIWSWDCESGEVSCSELTKELLGVHPKQELDAARFLGCIHDDDRERIRRTFLDAIKTGRSYDVEYRCVWPDGGVRWLAATGSCRSDADGVPRYTEGIVQNIDDRKSAELAMRRAKQAAEEANRAKSNFLANMSHELRTPLNAVIGYCELLRDDPTIGSNVETAADLEKIHAAAMHLLSLIQDVLDLSRIEAGRQNLSLSTFDVNAVIRGAVAASKPQIEENGNSLEIDCPRDPGVATTDATKLRQVLINLLGNAAKFTMDGTITLHVSRIERPDGDLLEFSVEDTGVGIESEHLDHIFDEFKQADDSTTREFGGTGLGLAISRRNCLLLQGDISVASKPGVGSTFTVRIPAEVADVQAATEVDGMGDSVCKVA